MLNPRRCKEVGMFAPSRETSCWPDYWRVLKIYALAMTSNFIEKDALTRPLKYRYSKRDKINSHLNTVSFMTPKFIFKPLAEHNLELLCTWFNEPHVKTWNDGLSNEEIKSKYLNRINNPDIRPFIAYLDDQPIGFIQYYYAHKIDNDWDLIEMESTVGLDQFIGEPDYINRGYGTKMIEQFVALLFSDAAIKKIIIDVDKNNQRAIRCYEKAGFSFLREITTSTSLLNLMVREKSNNLRH